MAARWIAVMALLVAPGAARTDDGWRCEAAAQWSLCASNATGCISHSVQAAATSPTEATARDRARTACQLDLGVQRIRGAWVAAPDSDPESITRVDTPCSTVQCQRADYTEDPMADAFDDPVCIGVRVFICDLCGQQSALCTKVQHEQPVTAAACSDTHARLQMFSDFMGQVDSLQPGAWTEARSDLCGT